MSYCENFKFRFSFHGANIRINNLIQITFKHQLTCHLLFFIHIKKSSQKTNA